MLSFTYDETEAAMCLWEECIRRQTIRDDDMFRWLAGDEGAASARDMCIELAAGVERSYYVAKAFGFDTLFDWEFVPAWTNYAMEITEEGHILNRSWLNYIGYKVAWDDFAKEGWNA